MKSSVIIVTLDRPSYVHRCLECLFAQMPQPDQIIIVDASPNDLTQNVANDFPSVLYLRNDNGYGRMTVSRNIGVKAATGQIIAFLDDDAFAHPGWLENLMAVYTDPTTGAVGGRVLNNQAGEEVLGVHDIGQLKPNGYLSGFFAADPGKPIEVDHIMGCNMSFRREVIAQLGGFREDYPGISGVREDSDMCLRVKTLGYKILFSPAACVDHVGAPQVKGQRFDNRYAYYSQRNHVTLLIRNFGPGAGIVWRYFGTTVVLSLLDAFSKFASSVVRLGVNLVGLATGISAGLLLSKIGRDPVRHDPEGQAITYHLMNVVTEDQVGV